MCAETWQAEQFERHRSHLRAVAARMLGSTAEADDAVQEAWLRLERAGDAGIENMRGWLTTVVSRICLDMLRARQARREELNDGWLPEPVVALEGEGDPEHEALLSDAVGVALLVVLERLSPPERLAFVLHDMFGMSFEEIAPIVERSVPATRQLASRARRRVRGTRDPEAADLPAHRRVVDAFLEASRNGDFGALVALLDPDVVFRADVGAAPVTIPAEVRGAEDVARLLVARAAPFAPLARPAVVNGRAGAVVSRAGRVFSLVAFTIVDGRVTELDLVLDPEKLQRV